MLDFTTIHSNPCGRLIYSILYLRKLRLREGKLTEVINGIAV
jgi:hypothetical protein